MIKWGLKKIIFFVLGYWFMGFLLLFFLANTILGSSIGFLAALILSFAFVWFTGIPGLILYFLLWNIVIKPGLIIGVMVPYIIFRFLAWFFIVLPLYAVGQSSKFTFSFFQNAEKNLRNEEGFKKPYIAVFLVFLIISFWFLGPSDITDLFTFLSQATFIGFIIVLIPVILTVLVSGLAAKVFGNSGDEGTENQEDEQERELEEGPNAVNMAASGLKTGRKGVKTYNSLKKAGESEAGKAAIKTGKKAGKTAATSLRSADVKAARIPGVLNILKLISRIPGVGAVLASGIAGVPGGVVILALIIGMILLVIVWLLIAGLFISFSYFIVQLYLPGLLGLFAPIAGAGDLASDYGGWVGSEASAATPHYDFTAERNALRLAGARVSCALEGPACLREYQMNNSQRPGSESEGQSFGLQIENFHVNDGHNLDVSGRSPDDDLRAGFSVYNPIRGLKGIDAHGVEYRITIDSERTECQTDWTSLGGEFAVESGIDSDEDGSENTRGTILAGDFAQPIGGMEDLNLGDCGLMQPALGSSSDAELEVRYNYSSQSTLQIQAMSEDHMLDQGMRPDPASSQTANTPVKTFINTRSPVVYREFSDGSRRPDIFPVSIGFETEDFNVGYQVIPEDLVIESSSLLADADNTERWDSEAGNANCDALTLDTESNTYELEEDEADRLDTDREYTRDLGPSPIECDMMIEEPESISPSGETINLRVDANYTVTLSSRGESFDTERLDCARSEFNCPLIVTEDQEEQIDGDEDGDPMFKSTCDSSWSMDASRGCTVIEGDREEAWRNPQIMSDDSHNAFDDGQIDNNEQAYRLSNLVDEIKENADNNYYNNLDSINVNPEEVAAGVDPDTVENPEGTALILTDDGVEFENVRAEFCDDNEPEDWFNFYVGDGPGERNDVIIFTPETVSGNEARDDGLPLLGWWSGDGCPTE